MAEEILSQNQEENTESNQNSSEPVQTSDSIQNDTPQINSEENAEKAAEEQKAMTPAERKKYLLKKVAEKKAKEKAEREEKKRLEREARNANGGSGNGKKIILFIILAIVVIGLVAFLVKKINSIGNEGKEEKAPQTETIIADTVQNEVENITEEVANIETESEPTQEIKSNKLPFDTPCYLVIYGAFQNEEYAKINANKLKQDGNNANYFLTKDYDPQGNDFYKVFVGPYTNVNDAKANLVKIQAKSENAYILYLK